MSQRRHRTDAKERLGAKEPPAISQSSGRVSRLRTADLVEGSV